MKYNKYLIYFILCFPGVVIGNSDIPEMYKQVARDNNIPEKIFFSLILQESKSLNSGKVLPWPWTINYKGQGLFFQTKEGAVQYASKLVSRKISSFDVGLGQMNWFYHSHKFNNLWEAFDPLINLTESAKYLKEQHKRSACNNWILAAGCYHRPGQREKDKIIADKYRNSFVEILKELQ